MRDIWRISLNDFHSYAFASAVNLLSVLSILFFLGYLSCVCLFSLRYLRPGDLSPCRLRSSFGFAAHSMRARTANSPPPTAPGKLGDFPFCSFCLARIFDISQIEMCANLNCRCLLLGAIVSGIFQALEHANTETHTHRHRRRHTHTASRSRRHPHPYSRWLPRLI